MTPTNHSSFSPSQFPDSPHSPRATSKMDFANDDRSSACGPNTRRSLGGCGGAFSSADIDFLVNLVLGGEWRDVEFYIQFLISHYEQFLNTGNKITDIIVDKLYELLIKVKTQKFYEAIECNDSSTAITILTKEISTLNNRLTPQQFQQMKKLFNNRNSFHEFKIELARNTNMACGPEDSCVKYRNIVATEVREQLNELLTLYGGGSPICASEKLSNVNRLWKGGSSKARAPTVVEENPRLKRKVDSESASETEPEKTSDQSNKTVPISFSPHPSNYIDFISEYPSEGKFPSKKRKITNQSTTVSVQLNPSTARTNSSQEVLSKSTSPSQKLGNMDVLLEAFDIMAHNPKDSKNSSPHQFKPTMAHLAQIPNDDSPNRPLTTKPSKMNKPKQPKLDAASEKKITASLDFQTIKPSKTIKPVRKLCTGGITSTPAIRERMIKVLEQYKTPVTWETIQHKVSGNRAKVWATLCMFVNEGIVTQTGKGRRGHPYKYIIKPDVTIDSVQGEMESKFRKLDHESMKLHRQYREKQQEEIQQRRQQEILLNQQSFVKQQYNQVQQTQTTDPTKSSIFSSFTPQQYPDIAKLSPHIYSRSLSPIATSPFRSYTNFEPSNMPIYRGMKSGFSSGSSIISSSSH